MADNGKSLLRTGFFGIVLIVGFLLGRFFTTGSATAGHQFIQVGPKADQVSGALKPQMSRSAGHEATWKSTTGKALTIFFKDSELPLDGKNERLPPFESMTRNETDKRWEVKILGSDPAWRFSGPINPALKLNDDPRDKGLEFKYWQILEGANPELADGKMIIKW